eukprot:135280-Rhodomonas_salina.2
MPLSPAYRVWFEHSTCATARACSVRTEAVALRKWRADRRGWYAAALEDARNGRVRERAVQLPHPTLPS